MRKRWNADSPGQMKELRDVVAGVQQFTSESLEKTVKEWIVAGPYNTGTILNLFRLLMVGASRGPHLFDIVELTGRDETLRRLDTGILRLSSKPL